jgi:hypothetical protein
VVLHVHFLSDPRYRTELQLAGMGVLASKNRQSATGVLECPNESLKINIFMSINFNQLHIVPLQSPLESPELLVHVSLSGKNTLSHPARLYRQPRDSKTSVLPVA